MNNARAAFAAKEILASCESGHREADFWAGSVPASTPDPGLRERRAPIATKTLTRLPLITIQISSSMQRFHKTRISRILHFCPHFKSYVVSFTIQFLNVAIISQK